MRRRFFALRHRLPMSNDIWFREGGWAVPVWVALSESFGPHVEAAAALRAEVDQALPGRVDWRIAHWSQFGSDPRLEPQWIVAVGTAALKGMQDLYARDATPPLAGDSGAAARFRADGGPGALARRLVVGGISRPAAGTPTGSDPARAAGRAQCRNTGQRTVERLMLLAGRGRQGARPATGELRGGTGRAVSGLCSRCCPTSTSCWPCPIRVVFNSQTAGSILTAAYRRQVPLTGFSPAYVKAGALLALYSTPAQVGARGGAAAPGTGGQAAVATPVAARIHSGGQSECRALAGPGAGRIAPRRAIAAEGPAMSMSLRKRMTLLALLPAALVAGLLTAVSLWHDIDNLRAGLSHARECPFSANGDRGRVRNLFRAARNLLALTESAIPSTATCAAPRSSMHSGAITGAQRGVHASRRPGRALVGSKASASGRTCCLFVEPVLRSSLPVDDIYAGADAHSGAPASKRSSGHVVVELSLSDVSRESETGGYRFADRPDSDPCLAAGWRNASRAG
jgi:hypothetical protein